MLLMGFPPWLSLRTSHTHTLLSLQDVAISLSSSGSICTSADCKTHRREETERKRAIQPYKMGVLESIHRVCSKSCKAPMQGAHMEGVCIRPQSMMDSSRGRQHSQRMQRPDALQAYEKGLSDLDSPALEACRHLTAVV